MTQFFYVYYVKFHKLTQKHGIQQVYYFYIFYMLFFSPTFTNFYHKQPCLIDKSEISTSHTTIVTNPINRRFQTSAPLTFRRRFKKTRYNPAEHQIIKAQENSGKESERSGAKVIHPKTLYDYHSAKKTLAGKRQRPDPLLTISKPQVHSIRRSFAVKRPALIRPVFDSSRFLELEADLRRFLNI